MSEIVNENLKCAYLIDTCTCSHPDAKDPNVEWYIEGKLFPNGSQKVIIDGRKLSRRLCKYDNSPTKQESCNGYSSDGVNSNFKILI